MLCLKLNLKRTSFQKQKIYFVILQFSNQIYLNNFDRSDYLKCYIYYLMKSLQINHNLIPVN